MTTVQSRALPPPSNWQDFERLCFDLYSRFWKTSDAAFNGRSGQPQAGVDVYGTDRTEDRFTGVQCKGRDGDYGRPLTKADLLAEVEKAKTFEPALEVFIVATTAPDDVALLKIARQISKAHREVGLFEVRVQGWATLKQVLTDHLDVVEKHFPDLAPRKIDQQIAMSEGRIRQDIDGVVGLQNEANQILMGLVEKLSDQPTTGDPLQEQISLLSALLNQGEAKAALKALLKLEGEVSSTASARNRYRLRANVGSALLNLGRTAEAIEAFKAAYALDPDWPNAMAIGATAAVLEDRHRDAYALAEAALSADPTSRQAALVLMDAAPFDVSTEELEKRLGQELCDHLDVLVGLSLRATRMGDDAAAARYSESAYRKDPNDWRSLSAVAETTLKPILAPVDIAFSHKVAPEDQAEFELAITHLQAAWTILKERMDGSRGIHVAVNLISALEVDGRAPDAELVLDEALAVAPTYSPLLRRLAQRYVGEDNWEGVRTTLAKIIEEDLVETDRVLRAQALAHLGDPAGALAEAEAVEQSTADDRIRELAASMQIEASNGLGRTREVASILMSKYSRSIIIRSVAVSFLEVGDPVREQAISEIGTLAAEITDPRDVFHAAEAFFAVRRFSEAAELYKLIAAPDKDTLALRRLVISLHNAGRRREARELFEHIPDELRLLRRYAEIGSAIYQQSGLLPQAKELLEAAIAADPTDLENRLAWMNVAERLGQSGEVAEWLKTVPADIFGEPEQLIQIAGAMDRLGVGLNILPIAYRALREGYNDPRIHTNYTIGLFIAGQVGRRDIPVPEVSGPDVAITLREVEGDRVLTYVLETERDPRIEREEIAPDNPLWPALLGLHVGDEVELSNLGASPSFFKVEAITNKYVHAHFRSLSDFPKLFPTDKTLGKFTIDPTAGEAGFSPLLDSVRRRAEQGRKIEDFYRSGSLPLALFGQLAGVTPFEVWDAITQGPDLILMTCVGTNEELTEGRRRFVDAASAVVDPITLFGLVRMDIADLVLGGFTEVGVVQGTIDLLRAYVAERRDAIGTSGGSLQVSGDSFALVTASDEWAAAKLADAEAALAQAEKLTVYPSEAQEAFSGEAANFFEGLPSAYADTVFAAQSPDRVLISDDRAFRLLAESTGHVKGIWSQAIVSARAAADDIDLADTARAVLALVRARSTFTMLPTPVISHVLDDAGWTPTEDVRTLIRHATDPASDQESVYSLWADVLARGWFRSDREAFKVVATAILQSFRDQQQDVPLTRIVGQIMQRIAARMLRTLPIRRTEFLDTSSMTPLETLRKPARMAIFRISDEIHRTLQAAAAATSAG